MPGGRALYTAVTGRATNSYRQVRFRKYIGPRIEVVSCVSMTDFGGQIAYWEGPGSTKTFTHPLNLDWLADVRRAAPIVDYGCGYGRIMAELSDHGFSDVSGVDVSPALISRGRKMRPDLCFSVLDSPPTLPYASATRDVVLLFAVLTCVPDDEAQRALITELHRVLASGGLLYLSDVILQDDERNRNRYSAHARQFSSPYGVFATEDGAVCRHNDIGGLRALLSGFYAVDERTIEVATMNGHRARGVQLLTRKR